VLLEDLSERQRELGRLLLLDGLRRAEAADRLGVSRATVSVLADRGRIREIDRLARALATIFGRGVARLAESA
jgi:DNA-directed RNA polymerase specialized sigma24 family protein